MITLAIIAAIVGLFITFVGTRPTDFKIQRSVNINTPPDAPFALVNDFHKWPLWSPWEQIDPNMQRTYEGPESGTGAIYSWSGNNKIGAGRMTLGETHPNSLIRIKLEFFKPFKATNTAEFSIRPEGKQTVVTWTMLGTKNFLMKFMHLIMNMEKMVGPQFEKGLAQLKAICEDAAQCD